MTPLRQRMINDMTVRGLAESTRGSYLRSVTRLARHYRRSPERISAREVQDYLLFLHQQHGLSWSTCNTIRHGVRFFYRITLGLPDPHFYVPGAKEPSTLPQILNRDELVRLFTVTTNLKHRAVLMTAYAAGLRASELGRLQVLDIDSARMCLRVDQGKGSKDRYVPLSPRLLEQLREYWRRERPRHWLFPTRPLDRPMSRQTPTRIYQDAKDKACIGKAAGFIPCDIAMPAGCSRPAWSCPSSSAGSGTAPSARPCVTCIWLRTRLVPPHLHWTCWSSRLPPGPERWPMPTTRPRLPGRRWRSPTSCASAPTPIGTPIGSRASNSAS